MTVDSGSSWVVTVGVPGVPAAAVTGSEGGTIPTKIITLTMIAPLSVIAAPVITRVRRILPLLLRPEIGIPAV